MSYLYQHQVKIYPFYLHAHSWNNPISYNNKYIIKFIALKKRKRKKKKELYQLEINKNKKILLLVIANYILKDLISYIPFPMKSLPSKTTKKRSSAQSIKFLADIIQYNNNFLK